ncbi:hypothetical protein BaRGS_00029285 [Batillaria attramentaria]|uniref:Uncharacterized protein n=1 Tax=Batillaria attramentaria TaxID=370345 RepID=A0ABD0JXK3_9CAEN
MITFGCVVPCALDRDVNVINFPPAGDKHTPCSWGFQREVGIYDVVHLHTHSVLVTERGYGMIQASGCDLSCFHSGCSALAAIQFSTLMSFCATYSLSVQFVSAGIFYQCTKVGAMVLSLMRKFADYVRYCYFQYTLATAVVMLEPQERYVINAVIALLISLIIFSSIVYLPGNLMMLLQFLLHVSGIVPYAVSAEELNTNNS